MLARTAVVGFLGLVSVSAALGASSQHTTPIPCNPVHGASWSVTLKSPGGLQRGSKYYVYETANLSCAAVERRVTRLSRMTPGALRRATFVINGERLHCLTARLPPEIKSLTPRTAWGWCGTDMGRVARLGVMAAAGTEFFWVTADKLRDF